MVAYRTTDSTFWSDGVGCVWRRIPVLHRATGAFAILYSRVVYGGSGTLLQAFEQEFMPLPEVFPAIQGYTSSVEGALVGFVAHLQGADTAVFPLLDCHMRRPIVKQMKRQ